MATIAITLADFVAKFDTLGTPFAAILTVTEPKLLKNSRQTGEPCPFAKGVRRLAWRHVQLGANYGNAVNLQREREEHPDKFVPEGLWKSAKHPEGAGRHYGKHLIRHVDTGETYFGYRPASDKETGEILPHKVDIWQDIATGTPVDVDKLQGYLPKQSGQPATQETDKRIVWQTVKTANVVAVKCGDEYVLDHNA